MCEGAFTFKAVNKGDLGFKKGEVLTILQVCYFLQNYFFN